MSLSKDIIEQIASKTLPLKNKGVHTTTENLLKNIRRRLNYDKSVLSDKMIKKLIYFYNSQLGEYLLDNPEGFQLLIQKELHGVLAVSKHLPKEFRENKYDTIEKIKADLISDTKKALYLKRFEKSINARKKFENPSETRLNLHSFFYIYRFIWFNHKNTKSKKARAYRFDASDKLKEKLGQRIKSGEDYYEYNFNDFYRYKVKPIY